MARPTAKINLTEEQRQTIKSMERKYAEAGRHRWADQCRAIRLLADGYGLKETSNILERPYSTVQQWSRRFRRMGIRGLVPKTDKRGRKKKLGLHERMLLYKAIERGPREAGYPGNVWTSIMVSDYIKKRWGVQYHPGHVRKLLHELGLSVQIPTDKLAFANPDAQKQWMEQVYPEIKKTPRNKER